MNDDPKKNISSDSNDDRAAIAREKSDPKADNSTIPLWFVSFAMAIVFWAGAYLAFYSGGFQSTVFDPAQATWVRGATASQGAEKAAPDPMVVGKRLFTANCVACHQATGQGIPGQFPPLVGSEWVLGNDWHGDNHLIRILLHGLQGPIQVKGANYNGAMPAWKQLTDDQIAAILTYIRNEWGNSAPPISAEQVAKIRAETSSQTEPNSQDALKAIPAEKFEAPAPAAPKS